MKRLFAIALIGSFFGFTQSAKADFCQEFYYGIYFDYYSTQWNCAGQGHGAAYCYGMASMQAAETAYQTCLYY